MSQDQELCGWGGTLVRQTTVTSAWSEEAYAESSLTGPSGAWPHYLTLWDKLSGDVKNLFSVINPGINPVLQRVIQWPYL